MPKSYSGKDCLFILHKNLKSLDYKRDKNMLVKNLVDIGSYIEVRLSDKLDSVFVYVGEYYGLNRVGFLWKVKSPEHLERLCGKIERSLVHTERELYCKYQLALDRMEKVQATVDCLDRLLDGVKQDASALLFSKTKISNRVKRFFGI